MKNLSMACIAALAASSLATPAFAQAVTPAATPFSANDPSISFDKPGFFTGTCDFTLTAKTGPDIGSNRANTGHIYGGSNVGACAAMTVDAADFTIDSIAIANTLYNGTIDHVIVRYNGTPICDQTNVPFQIDNLGYISILTTLAAPVGAPPPYDKPCDVDGYLLTYSANVVGIN